jgi:hypothetical protein
MRLLQSWRQLHIACGELCWFEQIDTILPPAASGSKRELPKFSLFTCNLRSTEIISDHLKSQVQEHVEINANHLKSIEILAILRSRGVALASKSLCILLSDLQPMQEANSPNSSWFQVCIVVPTSYIFCECLYWFSWFFQLPEYFTQTFGNQ